MRILEAGLDLDNFMRNLEVARQRVLLLDYDGTLAPFRVERNQATPFDGVREVLTAILHTQRTRIVIISGRAIRDLVPLLAIEPPPEIWGSHGWERLLPDGRYQGPELDQETIRELARARVWIEEMTLMAYCEHKPASLALHWRGLDAQTAAELRTMAQIGWAPLVHDGRLTLKSFDGGMELQVPGKDKGFAVRTVLDELDEQGVVAYLGDDLTDEDAFKAIKGKGLGILVRAEYRETAASIWLKPPEELLSFLAYWR